MNIIPQTQARWTRTSALGHAFALLAPILLLAACSSSPSSGCTKDTDCAAGRICGSDGRCQDTTSGSSGTSSGGNTACLQYLETVDFSCSCQCGTICLTEYGHCGLDCTSDVECQNFWRSEGGDPTTQDIYCQSGADECVFGGPK